MRDNKARDLWAEVRAADSEQRRKWVELGGRIIYAMFIVAGGTLALDLYTRPDSVLLKVFGVAAAVLLVASDIFWSWATHHSAAGQQRIVAYIFWAAGLTIFALNVITEYLHYLGQDLGVLKDWYYIGSISTVVVAAFGWALYSLKSPDQQIADVAAKAKATAVSGLMRGIEQPDEATKQKLNEPIVKAAEDLASYAAGVVSHYVGNLFARNGQTSASTLNETVKQVEPDNVKPSENGNGTRPNAQTPRS